MENEGNKTINTQEEWEQLREEWLSKFGEINYENEIRPLQYPCTVNYETDFDLDFYVEFVYNR